MKSQPSFKILSLQEGLEHPILLTSSKLQPCLSKQPVNTQRKLKELEIVC